MMAHFFPLHAFLSHLKPSLLDLHTAFSVQIPPSSSQLGSALHTTGFFVYLHIQSPPLQYFALHSCSPSGSQSVTHSPLSFLHFLPFPQLTGFLVNLHAQPSSPSQNFSMHFCSLSGTQSVTHSPFFLLQFLPFGLQSCPRITWHAMSMMNRLYVKFIFQGSFCCLKKLLKIDSNGVYAV